MNYLDFTAEETSMVAIYAKDTRAATIGNIAAALSHMDADMTNIAQRSAAKLAAMTDNEFAEMTFTPADEQEPDEAA